MAFYERTSPFKAAPTSTAKSRTSQDTNDYSQYAGQAGPHSDPKTPHTPPPDAPPPPVGKPRIAPDGTVIPAPQPIWDYNKWYLNEDAPGNQVYDYGPKKGPGFVSPQNRNDPNWNPGGAGFVSTNQELGPNRFSPDNQTDAEKAAIHAAAGYGPSPEEAKWNAAKAGSNTEYGMIKQAHPNWTFQDYANWRRGAITTGQGTPDAPLYGLQGPGGGGGFGLKPPPAGVSRAQSMNQGTPGDVTNPNSYQPLAQLIGSPTGSSNWADAATGRISSALANLQSGVNTGTPGVTAAQLGPPLQQMLSIYGSPAQTGNAQSQYNWTSANQPASQPATNLGLGYTRDAAAKAGTIDMINKNRQAAGLPPL